jgi:hypothetical protein
MSNCKGKDFWESPILPDAPAYRGGEPGPDRVIFAINTDNADTNPTDNGVYCGVVTHGVSFVLPMSPGSVSVANQ